MKTNKDTRTPHFKYYFSMLLAYVTISISLSGPVTAGSGTDANLTDFAAFYKALEDSNNSKAISIGDSLFKQLEKQHRSDRAFDALKSKLTTAGFLANQMASQLKKATNKQMLTFADELFDKKPANKSNTASLAPAKSFYKESVKLFSAPIKMNSFKDEEKDFLAQYYNFKLRTFTTVIANAGQALTISEPAFKGTHDYVLVLPLLHVPKDSSVNINTLPRWMQSPEQLDIFSDSCLLNFGLPFHAMMIAKSSAKMQNKPFSELDFYRSAGNKFAKSHPHIAADCLRKALDYVPAEDVDSAAALQFDSIQLWLASEDFTLAAGQARRIYETFPNHKDFDKAIWLYYYALSRSNNTDAILVDIDTAIQNPRCQAYKAKLMYVKWWSLYRQKDKTVEVDAIEHQLLREYGNDPLVAPILLSRATDSLARQDYNGAYESLNQIIEKFPLTQAATQAKKMLGKLKTLKPVN